MSSKRSLALGLEFTAVVLVTFGYAGRASLSHAEEPLVSPPAEESTDFRKELDQLRDLVIRQSTQLESQRGEIDRLRQEVDHVKSTPAQPADGGVIRASAKSADQSAQDQLDRRINDLIVKYDKEHSDVPKGVQTGYLPNNGFYIRSVPDPKWDNWEGKEKIPFELRVRGRAQLAYYNFSATGRRNSQTNLPFADAFGGVQNDPDFSALEVKRLRLIFEGTAFDPDLKYRFQLNGDTRGLGGFFNNNHLSTGSPGSGGSSSVEGGGVTTDHAVRLFEAWASYDLHGCPRDSGCDDPCSPHVPNYRPTYSLIFGKLKLLGPLEEYLGSGNEQFVEFSAASWMFSPDDDNLANAIGVQSKMMDDRLYTVAFMHNGSESNFAANQIDNWPGFNIGAWYDFGGTWDEEKKKWKLFGDSMSDIDTSDNWVVRVGGAADFIPMNHRALYGDEEQSRFRTVDGGARLIDVLNGAGNGLNAVDRFDAYIFNTFIAAKYSGFSISNEWWCRVLTDFDTVPGGNGAIKYKDFSTGAGVTKTFDKDSLVDFGMQLQGGYFFVPKKWEVVARWSSIWGESGNINGGFDHNEVSNEYTVGLNYFMHRHQLKWQNDFGLYDGGNPANASAAGFLTNRDGWLFRSQVQLAF